MFAHKKFAKKYEGVGTGCAMGNNKKGPSNCNPFSIFSYYQLSPQAEELSVLLYITFYYDKYTL